MMNPTNANPPYMMSQMNPSGQSQQDPWSQGQYRTQEPMHPFIQTLFSNPNFMGALMSLINAHSGKQNGQPSNGRDPNADIYHQMYPEGYYYDLFGVHPMGEPSQSPPQSPFGGPPIIYGNPQPDPTGPGPGTVTVPDLQRERGR